MVAVYRSVLIPAQCGGKTSSDDRTEQEECCVPGDCQLSAWSTWSPCMFGELKRTRTVLKSEAKCGGIPCGNYPLEEVKECLGGESAWLQLHSVHIAYARTDSCNFFSADLTTTLVCNHRRSTPRLLNCYI